MAKCLRLAKTYRWLHCIRRAIPEIAFVISWKMEINEPFLQEIHYSLEVFSSSKILKWLAETSIGCGRFFQGSAEEMHKALNEILASLPDDTKIYVSKICSTNTAWYLQLIIFTRLGMNIHLIMSSSFSLFPNQNRSRSSKPSPSRIRTLKGFSQSKTRRSVIISEIRNQVFANYALASQCVYESQCEFNAQCG